MYLYPTKVTKMELKKSGLPLFLEKNRLEFKGGLKEVLPAVRLLGQMKQVLLDKEAAAPKELYCMYRGVCLAEHAKKIFENNLRYDITVIPGAKIGKEFVKTLGHFHPKVFGANTCFPEVYEVISGTAHYLLQTEKDFVVVAATAGEKVIMPPGYGHVTVNPKKETLVMANWVEKNFESDYSLYREKGGAMFFETTTGWKKNTNYKKIPKLRKLKPINFPEFGLEKNVPMYSLVLGLKKLDFLKNPQKYKKSFELFLGR